MDTTTTLNIFLRNSSQPYISLPVLTPRALTAGFLAPALTLATVILRHVRIPGRVVRYSSGRQALGKTLPS
jgi:hypothetical protein